MDILLINANPVVSRMMALSTRDEIYRLEEIVDGVEAKKAHYDIIFLDDGAYTPGIEALLKRVDATKKVFLTSKREKLSGFDWTIHKPFLPSQIVDVLEGRGVSLSDIIESEVSDIERDERVPDHEKEEHENDKIDLGEMMVNEATDKEEESPDEDDPFGLTFEELLDLSGAESQQEEPEALDLDTKNQTEEDSANSENALLDLDIEALVDLSEPDKDEEEKSEAEQEKLEWVDLERSESVEEPTQEENLEALSDLSFEALVELSDAEEKGEKSEGSTEEVVDAREVDAYALSESDKEKDAIAAPKDEREETLSLSEAEVSDDTDDTSEGSIEEVADVREDDAMTFSQSEREEGMPTVPEDESEEDEDAEMLAEPTEQMLAETVLDRTEIEKIKALIEEGSECETATEETLTPEEYESRKVEAIKEDLIAQGLEIVDEEEIVRELGGESKAAGEKQKKPKRKKKLTLEEIDRLEMMFAYTIRKGKPKKLRKLLKGKKVKLKLKDID